MIVILLLTVFSYRVIDKPRVGPPSLSHGFGQRGEIIILLVVEPEVLIFEEFPADGRPNRFGVLLTQIPHVRVRRGCQGSEVRGGFRVRVGQRGDSRPSASGATAASKSIHGLSV